jgi:hypothetical protein
VCRRKNQMAMIMHPKNVTMKSPRVISRINVELDSHVSDTPLTKLTGHQDFIVYCPCESSKSYIMFSISGSIKIFIMVKLCENVHRPTYTACSLKYDHRLYVQAYISVWICVGMK